MTIGFILILYIVRGNRSAPESLGKKKGSDITIDPHAVYRFAGQHRRAVRDLRIGQVQQGNQRFGMAECMMG